MLTLKYIAGPYLPQGPRSQSTYICREQSSVWRLLKYWPPTPPKPSESVLPPHQRRGGTHSLALRGLGSIFWKTPDIGLASYSIIPLRPRFSHLPASDQTRVMQTILKQYLWLWQGTSSMISRNRNTPCYVVKKRNKSQICWQCKQVSTSHMWRHSK